MKHLTRLSSMPSLALASAVRMAPRWFRAPAAILLVALALATAAAQATFAAEMHVAGDKVIGVIRPLHGVNGGPLNAGETVDVSAYWRELGIPITRLHDCEWPDANLVDLHAVFPSFSADPSLPESYQFARTDDYLQAISGADAQFVYRLGESIEHTRRKYHVAPPADNARWTAACLSIIRHENEGWAGGAHRHIRYWEIWNEPDNRPAMWTGSDDDYFRLYTTAAKGIKAQFPALLVGGPAVGGIGEVVEGKLHPTRFLEAFLKACQANSAPLDFFSWHTYSDDPHIYTVRARAIRRWLDEHEFRKTEIHLNEWNYLPGNEWGPLLVAGQGLEREKWYAEMGGPRGAAFVANVLIDLQDSPVDIANFYTGDSSPFGLFSRHGVPKKTFYAMKAFRALLDTPRRISATGAEAGQTAVCAGTNAEQSEISILVSNYRSKDKVLDLVVDKLPWQSRPTWKAFLVDERHDLEPVEPTSVDDSPLRLRFNLPAPGVLLVQLHRSEGESEPARGK